MKIFVVDDSSMMRKIVVQNLAQMGLTDVTCFVNGRLCLEALRANTPCDLILADWSMPEMDGITLLRSVRGMAECAKTPVVMITSESEREKIVAAISAGASSYLLKPFSPEAFAEKINQVLLKNGLKV